MRLPTAGPGLAGAAATFTGIGLARFAYTPLIPAMVDAGWFSAAQAAYLGAANLLGYLIGALTADRLASALGVPRLARVSMAGLVASFLLCATPAPFTWFALWRLISGITGAVLMIAGVSAAIGAVPAARRAQTTARVFTGIGVGVLLAAVVVPLLLRAGLGAAWLALGGLALGACLLAWPAWGRLSAPEGASAGNGGATGRLLALTGTTLAAYALDAVGFIPHTVFWVDYLARGRELGMDAASAQWALFGLGAVAGPALASFAARHLGWRRALVGVLAAKAGIVALPLAVPGPAVLAASSLVMGALVPGTVAVTSARIAELAGIADHRRVWGWATIAFALLQAGGGYALAAVFERTDSYLALFAISTAALLAAVALAWSSPAGTGR
ncbi:YbfB/YjiJ family MFS transporter [Arhodomonas aquaeolei]|uniref:YbfB/YjiJ family MFS transporter n=1 Tax=Arhodomonas aquaeolei TaxID=2369 RepID=UPI00038260AE|nr:YbfB/YjiJ family MFS transporter [Arhodomonas aquaeolei]